MAHVVAKIVQSRPFLEEALVNEIINYAYLADVLKPEIEQELRKEVNRYAIIMAMRRLTETLKESFVGKAKVELTGSDIAIISGIFEFTVTRDARTLAKISKLYNIVDFSKGDFLTITQGLYEITIISNSKYREEMTEIFSKYEIKKEAENLASLTVRISEDAADSVGVLYTLTKALGWHNVNIVEMVSTLTEEIFIISEDDTSVAFDAIKVLIKDNKKPKEKR